jgi:hypothetical protein
MNNHGSGKKESGKKKNTKGEWKETSKFLKLGRVIRNKY